MCPHCEADLTVEARAGGDVSVPSGQLLGWRIVAAFAAIPAGLLVSRIPPSDSVSRYFSILGFAYVFQAAVIPALSRMRPLAAGVLVGGSLLVIARLWHPYTPYLYVIPGAITYTVASPEKRVPMATAAVALLAAAVFAGDPLTKLFLRFLLLVHHVSMEHVHTVAFVSRTGFAIMTATIASLILDRVKGLRIHFS